MDNAAAGPPEPNIVLGTGTGKEVVDLLVNIFGVLKVSLATETIVPIYKQL